MDAVPLSQLLASEGWTEVGVVGLDQPQRLRSERRRIAAVAGLSPAGRKQRRRAPPPLPLLQPGKRGGPQPPQPGGPLCRESGRPPNPYDRDSAAFPSAP